MQSLGVFALYLAIGMILVLMAFPDKARGRRLLTTWGVPDPSAEQGRLAAAYLAVHRRTWMLAYFAGVAIAPLRFDGTMSLLLAVLAGLLTAELIAACWPARGARREAVLVQRRLRDLAGLLGPISYLLMLGVALFAAIGLVVARPWALASRMTGRYNEFFVDWRPFSPQPDWRSVWYLLGFLALLTTIVATIVTIAWRRRAMHSSDPVVDAALRTRSARVALALGIFGTSLLAAAVLGRVQALGAWPDLTGDPWLARAGFAQAVGRPAWLDAAVALGDAVWGGLLLIVAGTVGAIIPIRLSRPRLVSAMSGERETR